MNKKTILVIGATGQIGKLAINKLHDKNFHVRALVRDQSNATFPEKVELAQGDLESDFSDALTDVDTVVFTAGSGGSSGADKTLLVDLWGAKKAVDAARQSGVKHFIMVSARFAGEPDLGPEKIKHYLVAKHFADQYLLQSGLNYTILRLGRLTNEVGTDHVRCERPTEPGEQFISRSDSASIIAHCVNNPQSHGKVLELYQGDIPINLIFDKN